MLRGYQNILLLTTMYYEDEIRNPKTFAGLIHLPKVSTQELKMASQLITKLTKRFELSEFKNAYKEILKELIEAKAAGKPVKMEEARPTKDLMKALEASLATSKSGKRKKK
jgi:DNA end-binding protein Ku